MGYTHIQYKNLWPNKKKHLLLSQYIMYNVQHTITYFK